MDYYFEEFPSAVLGRRQRVFGPCTEEEIAELESIARRPIYVHGHEDDGCPDQLVIRGKG
jgi:hypothetical protein